MTAERADTGTRALPDRGELYRRARKVRQLADIVLDITGANAAADTHRARKILEDIAAICGTGEEE